MTDRSATIRFQRSCEAALAYHVLAHLPLRLDAASLHDDTLPPRAWVDPLLAAYHAAPGRLALHALGLRGVEAGLEPLRARDLPGLDDAAGRRLVACFLDAAAAEREPFAAAWRTSEPEAEARVAAVGAAVAEPLQRLRDALWEQRGPAPPLVVLDCPALGRAGRGARIGQHRVVAVSCAAPIEHVLCQVLHEEVHPVTDPAAGALELTTARDTRAGTKGHALHAALEHAALEVGGAVIEARAPAWAAAYRRWRSRFG